MHSRGDGSIITMSRQDSCSAVFLLPYNLRALPTKVGTRPSKRGKPLMLSLARHGRVPAFVVPGGYMPVVLTCANCGKQYSVPPSRAKYKTHFCSQTCMSQFNKGDRNPNWKGGLVVSHCRNCGEKIETKLSHAKKGEGSFCSRACQAAWVSANAIGYDPAVRVKKQCQVCGKDIFIKPSHMGEGSYCSRSCMAKGYTMLLVGQGNPNYRDGQAHQRALESRKAWGLRNPDKIKHYNINAKAKRKKAAGHCTPADISFLMRHQRGECVLCHCSIKEKYHVDHRIPIARGGHNGIGNLQLLCPACNLKKNTRFMVELKYGKKARRK